MKKIKKAIVLDLDETLVHGVKDENNVIKMILRPNLDGLIKKLIKAKKNGIDVILCTTARNEWVNRFLSLKPAFKDIFDKLYTRDNEKEWREFCKEEYPIEYEAQRKNINLEYMKPVTTFGYDEVLFIDDNRIEELRVQILFEIANGRLDRNVTFYRVEGFRGDSTDEKDNGCDLMCEVVEEFVRRI